MEDKSLSLWDIPLGTGTQKKSNGNDNGFKFGETKMEYYKRNGNNNHPNNHEKHERFEKELKRGMVVEREHTSDPKRIKKIAMDHLKEDPKYYTKLKTLFKH